MVDMCSPIASRYSAHMEDQPTAMSARTYARFSIQECKFNGATLCTRGIALSAAIVLCTGPTFCRGTYEGVCTAEVVEG